MQGYYGSETNLTRMFKNRDELPFSKQRYNYWRNRAMANDLPISTMALKEPYRHGLWRPPRPAIPPIQRMADANRALVKAGLPIRREHWKPPHAGSPSGTLTAP